VPQTKSAKKRVKQNAPRRLRNRAYKSALSTAVKKATAAIESNDPAVAEKVVKAVSVIARTSAKGVIHRNKAARKTSRLTKKLNAVQTAQVAQAAHDTQVAQVAQAAQDAQVAQDTQAAANDDQS
jgi:small subunit ribosomal protein S20